MAFSQTDYQGFTRSEIPDWIIDLSPALNYAASIRMKEEDEASETEAVEEARGSGDACVATPSRKNRHGDVRFGHQDVGLLGEANEYRFATAAELLQASHCPAEEAHGRTERSVIFNDYKEGRKNLKRFDQMVRSWLDDLWKFTEDRNPMQMATEGFSPTRYKRGAFADWAVPWRGNDPAVYPGIYP